MQPLSSSLSLASKYFTSSYANGSTSVLLIIRRSLAIHLAVLILVYLLVVVGRATCLCSLSLASKCFRSSYAPWKHFGAFEY